MAYDHLMGKEQDVKDHPDTSLPHPYVGPPDVNSTETSDPRPYRDRMETAPAYREDEGSYYLTNYDKKKRG